MEKEARDLEPRERLRLRRDRSAPIFNKLLEWVESIKDDEPPSLRFGRALNYFSNQQVPLSQFLADGRVPIDNGVVERLHVRAALTRKNFLCAGSKRGAQSAAIIFSLLGSCALCGIDPVEHPATSPPSCLFSREASSRRTSSTSCPAISRSERCDLPGRQAQETDLVSLEDESGGCPDAHLGSKLDRPSIARCLVSTPTVRSRTTCSLTRSTSRGLRTSA
ncbi:MAG: transposase [Deltaproteobacteria bacterium]|nr:transposase [Deltaproteobacteria bacterium]